MNPPLLLVADVHVGDNVIQGRPRLPVYRRLLDDILYAAQLHECVNIVIIGDLINQKNSMPREVYLMVYRWLKLCRDKCVRVHYLRGNHETPNKNNPEDSLIEMFDDICTVYNHAGGFTINDQSFVLLPYYPEILFLAEVDRLSKSVHSGSRLPVLLTHIGLIEGSLSPSNRHAKSGIFVKDLHPERWARIICGDYHACQAIDPNVVYLGAPIPHTFGDWNTKGAFLLDPETLALKVCPLPGFPQFDQPRITTAEEAKAFKITNIKNYIRAYVAPDLLESFREKHKNQGMDILPLVEHTEALQPVNSRISLEDMGSPPVLVNRWLDYKKVEDPETRKELREMGLGFLS